MGTPQLRSLLYIASWSAIRFNKACKAFYERLKARGKPGKVALIAVANKLIRQIFAILRDHTFYVDGYLSKLIGKPFLTGSWQQINTNFFNIRLAL